MTRLLATMLIAAVGVVVLAPPASGADSKWGTGGNAYTTNSGVGWYYSASQQAFFQTPASFTAPKGASDLEWTYVPTCDGNAPGGNANACLAALCTAPTGEPGVRFWVFTRSLSTPSDDWARSGTRCILGEQRVDLADVEAEVRRIIEDKFREIAEPALYLAPEAGGLVNLPMLAWTTDPGEVTLRIEQPLPGRIRATPSYTWAWSDGTTSSGPGLPYTPALSPNAAPDHYVHAIYADRGEGSVELTVTWQGDVTVPGLSPIEIAPLVYTSTTTFPVREARAQLVDAYG